MNEYELWLDWREASGICESAGGGGAIIVRLCLQILIELKYILLKATKTNSPQRTKKSFYFR